MLNGTTSAIFNLMIMLLWVFWGYWALCLLLFCSHIIKLEKHLFIKHFLMCLLFLIGLIYIKNILGLLLLVIILKYLILILHGSLVFWIPFHLYKKRNIQTLLEEEQNHKLFKYRYYVFWGIVSLYISFPLIIYMMIVLSMHTR
jgi:hypothetical protein